MELALLALAFLVLSGKSEKKQPDVWLKSQGDAGKNAARNLR